MSQWLRPRLSLRSLQGFQDSFYRQDGYNYVLLDLTPLCLLSYEWTSNEFGGAPSAEGTARLRSSVA